MKEKEKLPHKIKRNGGLALSPLLLLVLLFVVLGLATGDFATVPLPVVFLVTSIAAMFTLRGRKTEERISVFSGGAGQRELLLMVWIFVLAGAFSGSAKGMGAIDATVELTLHSLPSGMELAGMFLAACLVSICVGTSVGTIVALVPVAAALATRTGIELPIMVAAVTGGAFFGDNLSFISDTTVAATRTQGCSMSDKFRTNFRIVLPAAVVTTGLYIWLGASGTVAVEQGTFNAWRVLPYMAVLLAAVVGTNVLMVLLLGILLSGVVGLSEGVYTLSSWLSAVASGINDMGELILISMMAGGLLAVVRTGGGITYLVRLLTRRVHSRRGAETCIAVLVSVTNCCTANNTVAILSVGSIARVVSQRYGISASRVASLLDIFSCCVQGFLPYGAQLLMASGLAIVAPTEIIPYLFYPFILAIVTISTIAFSKG